MSVSLLVCSTKPFFYEVDHPESPAWPHGVPQASPPTKKVARRVKRYRDFSPINVIPVDAAEPSVTFHIIAAVLKRTIINNT